MKVSVKDGRRMYFAEKWLADAIGGGRMKFFASSSNYLFSMLNNLLIIENPVWKDRLRIVIRWIV